MVEGSRPVNVSAFAIHAQIHLARPEVVAAAHAHSIFGKAWSSVGRLLDPITQDACAFYEDHVFFDDTKVLITEASEGARLALGAWRPEGSDPPQPWPHHSRSDSRRGRLVVRLDGAVLSGSVSRRVGLHAIYKSTPRTPVRRAR